MTSTHERTGEPNRRGRNLTAMPKMPQTVRVPIWLIAVVVLTSLGMTVRGCTRDTLATPKYPMRDPIVLVPTYRPQAFIEIFEQNGLPLSSLDVQALTQLRDEWEKRPDLQALFKTNEGFVDMVPFMSWAIEVLSDATSTRMLPYRAALFNMRSRLGIVADRPLYEVVLVMLHDRHVDALSVAEQTALRSICSDISKQPDLLTNLSPHGYLSMRSVFTWVQTRPQAADLSRIRKAVFRAR